MKLKYYPLLLLSFVIQATLAKDYKGAELYSTQSWLYGKIEVRMKVAKASGILSTFFTYKNGSEISGTFWEEIDIEVLGKNNAQTFQSNIISGNPKKTTEGLHSQPFSLADDYHTYGLEWTPDYVAWFLDGIEVRKETGDQVQELVNPQSFRFNLWAANIVQWVGPFNAADLPVYQYVNWITYSSYTPGTGDNGTDFTFSWRDDFDYFNESRWQKANWTFGENLTDFAPENVNFVDGYLVLALTREGETGTTGTIPHDDVITSDQGVSAEESIRIYPNPTNNSFTIEGLENNIHVIGIRDSKGKLVHSADGGMNTIPDLQAGIYFIQFRKEDLYFTKTLTVLK